MLAIYCCVQGDDVSAEIWHALFGAEQSVIVTRAADLFPCSQFPGGLLLVGREPLQRQASATHRESGGGAPVGASLDDLLQTLFARLNNDCAEENDSNDDEEGEEEGQVLDAIAAFGNESLPVCGLGAGAVLLAKQLGAQIDSLPESCLQMDKLGASVCLVARMYSNKIVEFPPAQAFAQVLRGEAKGDLVYFKRNLVLGINALPEMRADVLLDCLDMCATPEAAEACIDSVRALPRQQSLVQFPPFWAMDEVCQFLGKTLAEEEEEEEESVEEVSNTEKDEEILLLRQRVAALELENEELKFKLDAFVISKRKMMVHSAEDVGIQALLLGSSDLELANSSLLKPLRSTLPYEIQSQHAVKTPVLSMAFCFQEGVLVYGQSNHLVCCPERGEECMLDAPPVFMTTNGSDLLAVGTLAGSIFVFTNSLHNKVKLASPHRKHLMGLEFDPTARGGLFSMSRDLQLCLWKQTAAAEETAYQVVQTLLFDESEPPECCTSVCVREEDGAMRAFLAIAKRGSQALTLVPFGLEQKQRLCALDLGLNETCLCMAKCPANLPVLALLTDRGNVLLVDVRNGGRTLRAFFGAVTCDEYSRPSLVWSDNTLVCTSAGSNSLLAFFISNPDHSKPVALATKEHVGAIRTLACTTFGKHEMRLASGGFDKKVIVRKLYL